MCFENFVILESKSLRDAIKVINVNKLGFVLTKNLEGKIRGIVTDGDIRRNLLEGCSLDSNIWECANSDFFWLGKSTSKEVILKHLDSRIKAIPILDEAGFLHDIVTAENISYRKEAPIYVRSRAPVRISFGGGGSDVTYFFSGYKGAVISSTISLFTHASLRIRKDKKIVINSNDIGDCLNVLNFEELIATNSGFGLFKALLATIKPDFGFELHVNSDFPVKSGLGGSAAVSAAVLGCFNQLRQDKWDAYELAELAFQAERLNLKISGGWQDQYATVFGGFNFIEFAMDQNVVHPLRIDNEILLELEESLVLCETFTSHDSGAIHNSQRETIMQGKSHQKVLKNVELSYKLRNYLLRGNLHEFGKTLHQIWELKKQFSDEISNDYLDKIYYDALEHGAVGGKLLGAGGGGFFIFYVPAFDKNKLISHLNSKNLGVHSFQFESEGLKSWICRERLDV